MSTEKNQEIVFLTLDSFDGDRSIKQHAFKSKIYKTKWFEEEYEGNISLCGKIKAAMDEDKYSSIEELKDEQEELNENRCCKKCLEIYNNFQNA